ncbi:MAG: hypothetical protein ACYCWW_15655 [Deltaproteobacteria bacterium]
MRQPPYLDLAATTHAAVDDDGWHPTHLVVPVDATFARLAPYEPPRRVTADDADAAGVAAPGVLNLFMLLMMLDRLAPVKQVVIIFPHQP